MDDGVRHMGSSTTIAWTDATWNPVRGCTRVSEGCRHCLTPDTPILYEDMVWRPLGNAQVGDVLLGFDETNSPGRPRTFRPTTIEAIWASRKPTVRIVTEFSDVTTTAEHRWLTHNSNHWVKTIQDHPARGMQAGATSLRQIHVSPSPESSADYRDGYIAGMTLGDGTFRYQPGQRSDKLGFPQCYWRVALKIDDEPALGRLVSFLGRLGIDSHVRPFDGGQSHSPNRRPMLKVETRALASCQRLHQLLHEPHDTPEYRRGFLAGFFDAEGSGNENLRVCQLDRAVLQRFAGYAYSLGFTFDVEKLQPKGLTAARLRGTLLDRIRFFAFCQPALIRKAGLTNLRMQQEEDPVLHIEPGTVQDVIDIQTSSRTFYAAGLATHNCYAERMAARFCGPGQPYDGLAEMTHAGPRWTGEVRLIEEHLHDPLRWRKPRRVFVNSMSDLFHERLEDSWIDRIFAVMALSARLGADHTFLVLTKRAERMKTYMMSAADRVRACMESEALARWGPAIAGGAADELWLAINHPLDGFVWPLTKVHLGVSVEDQPTADQRIPLLLQTPATVRWISAEPLLGAVDLTCLAPHDDYWTDAMDTQDPTCRLHWVVCGGESGPGHRPMLTAWAVALHKQCRKAGVPFFMKQDSGPRPGMQGNLPDWLWGKAEYPR